MDGSPLGGNMEMSRFETIYRTAGWAGKQGVLSGPGSTYAACKPIVELIERLQPEVRKILDLGCGDLEWIARCPSIKNRSIEYCGVDVVASLVAHHQRVFPWFTGKACSLHDLAHEEQADLVLIKDVLFHLSNEEVLAALKMVTGWANWKYLLATTHVGCHPAKRKNPSGTGMAGVDLAACGFNLGEIVTSIPRPDGGHVNLWKRSA